MCGSFSADVPRGTPQQRRKSKCSMFVKTTRFHASVIRVRLKLTLGEPHAEKSRGVPLIPTPYSGNPMRLKAHSASNTPAKCNTTWPGGVHEPVRTHPHQKDLEMGERTCRICNATDNRSKDDKTKSTLEPHATPSKIGRAGQQRRTHHV